MTSDPCALSSALPLSLAPPQGVLSSPQAAVFSDGFNFAQDGEVFYIVAHGSQLFDAGDSFSSDDDDELHSSVEGEEEEELNFDEGYELGGAEDTGYGSGNNE